MLQEVWCQRPGPPGALCRDSYLPETPKSKSCLVTGFRASNYLGVPQQKPPGPFHRAGLDPRVCATARPRSHVRFPDRRTFACAGLLLLCVLLFSKLAHPSAEVLLVLQHLCLPDLNQTILSGPFVFLVTPSSMASLQLLSCIAHPFLNHSLAAL